MELDAPKKFQVQ